MTASLGFKSFKVNFCGDQSKCLIAVHNTLKHKFLEMTRASNLASHFLRATSLQSKMARARLEELGFNYTKWVLF